MELERRRTLCPGCDQEYPLACGACPACGTLALQPSASDRFTVLVPEIPSDRQRAEVAAYLEKVLDCPSGGRALEAALAAGPTRLVDDLDQAPAQALAKALGRRHVQGVRVEPTRPMAVPFPWTWMPGYAPALLGLGIGLVGRMPLVGLLAGAVLSGVAMLVHRARSAKGAGSVLAMPVIGGDALPGWAPVGKQLAALLPTLPSAVRDPLGRLALSAAIVLDEYHQGSPPGDAALGVIGAGLERARAAMIPGTDATSVAAQLGPLADAADRARAELARLATSDVTATEPEQKRIADTLGQAARAALPPVA